jgi:2-dehydro-3-deoxyphosphogluconate aldolase/(4S)-4-hydroxy-2-oxoglutarate aldolase
MQAREVYEAVRRQKIIVILRGVDAGKIVDIANALYAGGIRLMEVTCNTPGVTEMIATLSRKLAGKMIIGAGTVITKNLCDGAVAAGAEYIVAPDVNPEVIKHALDKDIAVLPGAATATEVLTAARAGAQMAKIFPAAVLGPDYIRQLRGPIDNIDFVAVGGVRLNNIADFMAAGCAAVGIGTAALGKELIQESNWAQISRAASEYIHRLIAPDV